MSSHAKPYLNTTTQIVRDQVEKAAAKNMTGVVLDRRDMELVLLHVDTLKGEIEQLKLLLEPIAVNHSALEDEIPLRSGREEKL